MLADLARSLRPAALTRERLLPVVGAGLAVWAISAASVTVLAVSEGTSAAVKILLTLPPLLFWLVFVPVIVGLAAVFPLRRGRVPRAAIAHAVSAVVVAGLYAESMVWIQSNWSLVAPHEVSPRAVRFQFGILTYGLVLSWGLVHDAFTRMREREVAAARLEGQFAASQLRALKAQLKPHFLFNTLHAITVLIRHDPETAARTVTQLSDLLRIAITDGERQEASLADELRFLRLYLDIEQTRFGDRLHVVWDVAPDLLGAAVPAFVLQPLVENAVKHGIEPSPEGGSIAISASRRDGLLRLRVGDAGSDAATAPAVPAARHGVDDDETARAGTGLGLSSTRTRLELLYGPAHQLTIEPQPAGGTMVTVAIPFRWHEQTNGRRA